MYVEGTEQFMVQHYTLSIVNDLARKAPRRQSVGTTYTHNLVRPVIFCAQTWSRHRCRTSIDPAGLPMPTRNEHSVKIRQDGLALDGLLGVPPQPIGVIVFAHGSGSGRLSPRNTFVARHLQQTGLATLLLDLLTADEAEDRQNVFDIDLLADRILLAKAWLEQDTRTTGS